MLNAQTNIPESSDTATPTDGPGMGSGLRPVTVRPGEWNGPCPLCGGTDRFHVRDGGNGALVGCRNCIDGQSPNGRRQRFGEMLREVFPERFKDWARPHAYRPRRMPQNRRTAPGPAPSLREKGKSLPALLWEAARRPDESPRPGDIWRPGSSGPRRASARTYRTVCAGFPVRMRP